MSTRAAGFTLRTECTSCGMPLPLDRPVRKATCNQCHAAVAIPDAVWRFVLEAFEGERRPPAGKMITISDTVAGFRLHLQVANIPPRCERCGASYQLPDDDGDFACSCGDPASVWAAPTWLVSAGPTCRRIVSTEPGGASAADGVPLEAAVTDAVAPVAMPCPACGGSLRITADHERIVPCQYCNTDVFLPDEVWRRLHPVKTVQWWFAVFQGRTERELERDAHAADRARELEKDKRLAARAFRLVPAAWVAATLFVLWQAAAVFVVIEQIPLPGPGSPMANLLLASAAIYLGAVAIAARPLAVAEAGSWFKRTIGYALIGLFFLPPVAGAIFALLVLLLLVGKRDVAKPASGVGRPLGVIVVAFAVLPQFLFIYLQS